MEMRIGAFIIGLLLLTFLNEVFTRAKRKNWKHQRKPYKRVAVSCNRHWHNTKTFKKHSHGDKSFKRHLHNEKRSKLYKRTDIEKEFYLSLLRRSDIADDLYKNVLPYIKEVAQDAAKTKEEIRQQKHTTHESKERLKHDKNAILKELDKKVLPWLDDITKKVNSLSRGSVDKFKENLHITVDNIRKMQHRDGETHIRKIQHRDGETQVETIKESEKMTKKNNGQPDLVEYDENNRPILTKENYKEKLEEFINKQKNKENKKQIEKKKNKYAKSKHPKKKKLNTQSVKTMKGPTMFEEIGHVIKKPRASNPNNPHSMVDINKQKSENLNITPYLVGDKSPNYKFEGIGNEINQLLNMQGNWVPQQITAPPNLQPPVTQPTFGGQQPASITMATNRQPVITSQLQPAMTSQLQPAMASQVQPAMTSQPKPQKVDNEANKNIEFEVAELTNQIAEFQQEMDSITKDMENEEMNNDIEMNSFRRNLNNPATTNILDSRATTTILDATNNKLTNENAATLVFGGNVAFNGIIRYKVETGVCTYNESFDKVAPYLKKADHAIVNLASVFMESNTEPRDTSAAQALSYAGIDTVILANNHLLDFGPDDAKYTADTLQNNQLLISGYTKEKKKITKQIPVVYAVNGITLALLSYCMNIVGCKDIRELATSGPAIFDEKLVENDVATLKESGIDAVIVYMHWGNENELLPTRKIKDVVKKLATSNIDVLVGYHPYIESHYYYRGMLVFFSLGNILSPMHVQLHKSKLGGSQSAKLMNQLWMKQNERWETPSLEAKLLHVQFNRSGLVVADTKYLQLHMSTNKKHCPQPQILTSWIQVCSKEDKHCEGTNQCNQVECGKSV